MTLCVFEARVVNSSLNKAHCHCCLSINNNPHHTHPTPPYTCWQQPMHLWLCLLRTIFKSSDTKLSLPYFKIKKIKTIYKYWPVHSTLKHHTPLFYDYLITFYEPFKPSWTPPCASQKFLQAWFTVVPVISRIPYQQLLKSKFQLVAAGFSSTCWGQDETQ